LLAGCSFVPDLCTGAVWVARILARTFILLGGMAIGGPIAG